MILSISRRTDIPAFYPQWILNRLRAGEVWIRNPYSPHQVSRVLFSPPGLQPPDLPAFHKTNLSQSRSTLEQSAALRPLTADCLVFWSKNPGPMLPYLPDLESLGYPFYFQLTLTPYGPDIEPGLPPKRQILASLKVLGDRLGPQRVVWRYDPVLLSRNWTEQRHLQAFSQLCRALEGYVDQCVFSFLDPYPFLTKRTADLSRPSPEQQLQLVQGFAQAAASHGITLAACGEQGDFSSWGVHPSACIDPKRVALVSGRPFLGAKDRNQRPLCSCAASIDLGAYNCCPHRCRYCYATRQPQKIEQNRLLHHPDSPLLLGWPQPEDRVAIRKG